MEDNIDLQATSTTTCRTLVKFEHDSDEVDLGEKANTAALNFRLLQLQAPSLEAINHHVTKAFKMEPDTTLSELGASPTSQIPLSLLPLSPIQQPDTAGDSGSNTALGENTHQHNIFQSEFDFHLSSLSGGVGGGTEAKSVSSASGVGGYQDLDQLRSDCEDEPMMSCKKQRPHSRPPRSSAGGSQRRRSNSSTSTASYSKTSRIRKQISHDELQVQRNQANVRERMRTQSLNEAFQNLRQSIPTMPSDKMSKIQTLKLASDYIGFLYTVLKEGGDDQGFHQGSGGPEGNGGQGDKNLSYYFNMWRMQDFLK